MTRIASFQMTAHTIKYNRFYEALGTLIIERNDIKSVKQKYFSQAHDGYDWLWRIFIHGNIHDFHFIKRLKEDYCTLESYMKDNGLISHGGYKRNDNSIDGFIDTKQYKKWIHINAEKDFTCSHYLNSSEKWSDVCNGLSEEEMNKYVCENFPQQQDNIYACAQFPEKKFLIGKKLLLKKGVQADNYYPIICYNEGNVLFSSTVCSIIANNRKNDKLLKYISGLILHELFSYHLLNISSSTGVDRNRLSFNEFFDFPIPKTYNNDVVNLIDELYQLIQQKMEITFIDNLIEDKIEMCTEKLKSIVYNLYSINEKEQALMDYAQEISIPTFKRKINNDIFSPIEENKKDYLNNYLNIFINHFSGRFKSKFFGVEVSLSPLFVGVIFKIYDTPKEKLITFVEDNYLVNELGFAGIYEITPKLSMQQDIRGFSQNSFYIIKPNEKKCWHKAIAYLDLADFIDAIVKSESKFRKT